MAGLTRMIGRLQTHKFANGGRLRWGTEPDWKSQLRSIIANTEKYRRASSADQAFFRDHHRLCMEDLASLGLTTNDAKRLVFPDRDGLPDAVVRGYGLLRRMKLGQRTRPQRARARSARAAATASTPSGAEDPAPPDEPPPGPRLDADGLQPVLFAEDLARLSRVSVATARRKLAKGDYGPRFKDGRRWAVLKSILFAHWERISERPRRRQRFHSQRIPKDKRADHFARLLERQERAS